VCEERDTINNKGRSNDERGENHERHMNIKNKKRALGSYR